MDNTLQIFWVLTVLTPAVCGAVYGVPPHPKLLKLLVLKPGYFRFTI